MTLLRFVAAVVVGYLIFAGVAVATFMLTGRDPHASQPMTFMALATAVGIVGAFAGGYLATVIDRRAGLFVAFVIAVVAIASLIASHGHSVWSQVVAVTLLAPSAVVGFWKRRRATRRIVTSP